MSTSITQIGLVQSAGLNEVLKGHYKSFEKLASGKRLNSSADGAAELAISNLLRADTASIHQGLRNIRDGVSMLQTAEGSLDTVSKNLIRMKELAAQAGNDLYSPEQKGLIQREFDELAAQNAQIGQMTNYNGIRLHRDNQTISIMADGEQAAAIQTSAIPADSIDISDFEQSQSMLDKFLEQITSYRTGLGSQMNSLEQNAETLLNKAENILNSVSRIEDTDMATAVTSLTANQLTAQQAVATQVHSEAITQAAVSVLQ